MAGKSAAMSRNEPARKAPSGQRAERTRERILEALRSLLSESKLSWISVSDIVRASGLSAATFYRYFSDVEDAAYALALDLLPDVEEAAMLAEADWAGAQGTRTIVEFVEAFLAHWERNRPILRVRNIAAEERDPRFYAVRHRALMRIQPALTRKIQGNQQAGLVSSELDAQTAATMLVGMLERAGAFVHAYPNKGANVVPTAARILQLVVCGSNISCDPAPAK